MGGEVGTAFVNVAGSFYDFLAEPYHGTRTRSPAEPPDHRGGRAAVPCLDRLRRDPSFGTAVDELADVAETIDRIDQR